MKRLFIILLILPIIGISQTEKRLALVIGNSDYEFTSKLANPVNDALLIAKTLEELDFYVILGTNLVDEDAFIDKISEFGQKRPDYDVAFVFYAGHGSQIENQNYLLPTGINAKTEWDVRHKAVSVQAIMDFLTGMTDQVNVLILDACRDNNFEKEWGGKTRSASGGGSGLAKMRAPSGSLIAFSTTAGTTAPDGEGMNSDYSRVLAEQMKVPGISLDQVFRNVRRELLEISNGNQQTEESTQLTGEEAFYLVKSTYEKEFDLIDSLMENEEYITAIQVISKVITLDPKNKRAYKYQGDIYYNWKKYDKALESYNNAIALDDEYIDAYHDRYLVYSNNNVKDYDNALEDLNRILSIDSMHASAYNRRGIVYHYYLDDLEKGLADYNKVISIDSLFAKVYINRANVFEKQKKYNQALDDFNFGIFLSNDNKNIAYKLRHVCYENRGDYYLELEDFDNAFKDYNKALEINPTYVKVYKKRADLYKKTKDYTNALIDYTQAIDFDSKNPDRYIHRAYCYNLNKQHELALNDYNTAIRIKDDFYFYYYQRAWTNSQYLSKHEAAIKDFTKSIELNSTYYYNYRDRADAYRALGNTELALTDIDKAINIQSSSWIYNLRGNIYWFDLNDSDNALLSYQSAITIDSTYTVAYENRIKIYKALGVYEKVLEDHTTLISLDTNNAINYINRGDILRDQGLYDLALADYSKALELTSDDYSKARAINNRALIYGYQGEIELEIEEYSRALEIKKDALWYANRGIAYETLEQFDKALLDYNQMILLEPDNSGAWNRRADFYRNIENYQNAINDFNQSLKIDGKSAYTHWYLAAALSEFGEDNKSINHYTKAITIIKSSDLLNHYEIQQELSQIIGERALVYTGMGKIKKAINDCNESIELDSSNLFAYFSLSAAYLRLDDYKSSFAICDKGLKNTVGGESLFNLVKGISYSRISKFDSAYAILHHALEINEYPHMPVIIYDMLAKLSIHIKNYDKAIDYCMKAIENNEKDLNAYNNLSIIYEDQNNPFKAIVKLTKIIEQVSINELIAPNKDDALFKDYDDESSLTLSDLYIKRGKLWKIIMDNEEMCEDYKKACDLGNCKMFNENCK